LRPRRKDQDEVPRSNGSKFKVGDRVLAEFYCGKKFETELSSGTVRDVISLEGSSRYKIDFDSDSEFDNEEFADEDMRRMK
jgi:hypothetical protein